jgi:hypothetical protein
MSFVKFGTGKHTFLTGVNKFRLCTNRKICALLDTLHDFLTVL